MQTWFLYPCDFSTSIFYILMISPSSSLPFKKNDTDLGSSSEPKSDSLINIIHFKINVNRK